MEESLLNEIIGEEKALQERVSRIKSKIRFRLEREQSELEAHYVELKDQLQSRYAHKLNSQLDKFTADEQEQQRAFNLKLKREKETAEVSAEHHLRKLLSALLGVDTRDHQDDKS